MRQIVVGFSKPRNKIFPIFSWLIRLVERTKYSHVYIKIYDSRGSYFVYQASGAQVNIIGSKWFEKFNKPVVEYSVGITEEQRRELLLWLSQECGAPYSIIQILHICYYMVFKKTCKILDSNGYVCSELSAKLLINVLNIEVNKNLEIITPKDIEEICRKHLTLNENK